MQFGKKGLQFDQDQELAKKIDTFKQNYEKHMQYVFICGKILLERDSYKARILLKARVPGERLNEDECPTARLRRRRRETSRGIAEPVRFHSHVATRVPVGQPLVQSQATVKSYHVMGYLVVHSALICPSFICSRNHIKSRSRPGNLSVKKQFAYHSQNI